MADSDPSPDVARVQPPMEVSNRSRKLGTCCRRGDSVDRMKRNQGAPGCSRSSLLQKLDTNGSVKSGCSYSSFGERRVLFKGPVAELKTGNVAVVVVCRVL